MYKAKVFCLLLVMFLAPAIWSGQISPNLMEHLDGLAADEGVKILVTFKQQADIFSLDRQLKLERATLAERNRRVIEALQEVASLTQPAMVSYLEDLKSRGLVEDYRMLWISNMFIAVANRAGIEALASRPELNYLYLDYPIELIEPVEAKGEDAPMLTSVEVGLTRIHAPEAWALGYTGAGRVVSNLDTGVDGNHPALAARFRGDVDGDGDVDESWYDPYAGWTFPQDSGSHGTHTIGTMCGRSPAGDTIGVAIDALWIAAAPIDRGGGISRTIADALLSFQWIVDPDGNPLTQDNPDACGNSWGIPDGYGWPDCDDTFWTVIDNCEFAGTVIIFSAGNEGFSGLRSPADRATTYYNVFSVGAVDGNNPNLPIASWSARGPSECAMGDLAIKPEVVAPGVNVRSSVPGGGYTTMSGTSMASPHVTGAVAVIRQVNPDLDVDAIKEILMNTAEDLPFNNPDGEDNTYGHGVINLLEACLVAQQGYGFVSGFVYDELSQPVAGALVQIDDSPRRTFADSTGFYFIGLPADTSYTFIASFFGHLPDTAVIAVTPDDTVSQNFTLNFASMGVLNGHVTDLDSIPLEGAIVRVANTPLDPDTTDAQGYYIFDNIPGGSTYDIEAIASGHGLARASIFVPADDTVTLDFALQELQSFETDDGGWSGEGVWEWGAPTSGPGGAYDGNNVWGTVLGGQYPNNADDTLRTNFYSITEPSATFSFFHWYNLESAWDGGNIRVSTDGGQTWNIVVPEGGYPDPDVSGLDNEPGFSGQTNDWEQVIVDLSAYEGQTVMICFRFGSDGSVTRDGWFIDGVVLNGGVALFPSAVISPLSFNVNLDPGDTTTSLLTVSNNGTADLIFNAAVITHENGLAPSPRDNPMNYPDDKVDPVLSKYEANHMEEDAELKTEIDPPFNYDIITDIGGPDEFGYRFIDSDEPNGPAYEWIDITSIGTPVDFNHGSIDDGYTDLFPMGMTFEFYGQTYSDIMVSTNGWISFLQHSSSHLSNYSIPRTTNPNCLVAAQWDDLDGGTTGTCYFYHDEAENRFIVSWVDWRYYPDASTPQHSFQLILDGDDNSIVTQYGEIEGGGYQSDVTIGIENEVGTVGLEYAYNNAAIQPGLAIRFIYPLFWLTVSPTSGAVPPSESMDLDVLFDATELEEGIYTGDIVFSTNDPENATISVACTLNVGTTAIDEDSPLAPNVFSLGQNFPNPFNPATEISFGIPTAGHTTLTVYDLMGRKVRTLVDKDLVAGIHKIIWNSVNDSGDKVASGIYFYRLVHGDNVITKKMVFLK